MQFSDEKISISGKQELINDLVLQKYIRNSFGSFYKKTGRKLESCGTFSSYLMNFSL